MKIVTAKSYTLLKPNGDWLGQALISSDGMIGLATDYGNVSCTWRAFGEDFRGFLIGLDPYYFSTKLVSNNSYMVFSKKYEKACLLLAEKVLPVLQADLKEEIETEKNEGVEVIDRFGVVLKVEPKKSIGTAEVFGNNGSGPFEVITGLEAGNMLECVETLVSAGDIGSSGMTYPYNAFEKGKLYPVHHLSEREGIKVAYVMDKDNTLYLATTNIFKAF